MFEVAIQSLINSMTLVDKLAFIAMGMWIIGVVTGMILMDWIWRYAYKR